tara:strand:- start:1 stop:993 length:993 start_codon:yes stop_codon:yes gene_type:complete
MNEYLKNIKVTIGITCFNAEKTISKAIDGALNQDWFNKEIIIVDDASTDSSSKIIENYLNHKQVKFIKNQKNKGTSFSRNLIINNSNGEIICFMDDDDFSLSKRISSQLTELEKANYPNNKLIACTASMVREYDSGYKRDLFTMGSKGVLPTGEELANYLLFYEKKKKVDYGFGIPTASMLITKECFKKIGLFDENLKRVEDMDLSIRLSLANVLFVSAKDKLILQKSFQNTEKAEMNFNSESILIEKYKEYLKKKKLYWHSRQWPKLRFFYFKKKYNLFFITILLLIIKNPFRTLNHFFQTGSRRMILAINLMWYKYLKNFINWSKNFF